MNKAFVVLLLLTGCAAGPGIDRAEENQIVTEFYATVDSVRPVELSSQMKTGIMMGAGVGVIEELDGNLQLYLKAVMRHMNINYRLKGKALFRLCKKSNYPMIPNA